MGDDQGQRVGIGTSLMDEVDIQAVDLGDELVEPVEPSLPGPPVVLVGPMPGQLLHIVQRDALSPVLHTRSLRPAGTPQPVTQVEQILVGHRYPEWANLCHVVIIACPATTLRPMRLVVDLNKCQGYAQCVPLAPEVLKMVGEEALAYDPNPDESQRRQVLRAAASCPVQAIILEMDPPADRDTE